MKANLGLLWVCNGLKAGIVHLGSAGLGIRLGALNDEAELRGELICSLDMALNSFLYTAKISNQVSLISVGFAQPNMAIGCF